MNSKKQLIVCLDGLGFDLISENSAPFLFRLKKEGKLTELKTLFAWAGIEFSFFSGKTPDQHNVWFEFIRKDKSLLRCAKIFSVFGRKAVDSAAVLIQLLNGRKQISKTYNIPFGLLDKFDSSSRKNIWQTEFFENKKYLCYKWPFWVKNGKIKIIWRYENDEQRIKRLFNSLSDEIDIYCSQLVGLDKIIHKYGRNVAETNNKLKEIDNLAEKYYGKFLERFPQGEIYYWSDHSFCDIKKYLDIQSMMPKTNDYLAFYGGTHISLWFNNNEIKEKIIGILSQINEGYFLTPADRISQHIPIGEEHGEVIFAIKPGNLICPNYYQKSQSDFVSMHGYDTRLFKKHGILASNRELSEKKVSMDQVVDLLNR